MLRSPKFFLAILLFCLACPRLLWGTGKTEFPGLYAISLVSQIDSQVSVDTSTYQEISLDRAVRRTRSATVISGVGVAMSVISTLGLSQAASYNNATGFLVLRGISDVFKMGGTPYACGNATIAYDLYHRSGSLNPPETHFWLLYRISLVMSAVSFAFQVIPLAVSDSRDVEIDDIIIPATFFSVITDFIVLGTNLTALKYVQKAEKDLEPATTLSLQPNLGFNRFREPVVKLNLLCTF